MTVAELKQIISSMPDHYKVVAAKDAEGNTFSPVARITTARYIAETTWQGEIDSCDKDDAIVIWPVN